MQEAAERFRSGESDLEEIMTPNGPARLVRDPTNALGFRIDFVGGASRHTVAVQEYPPSPGRPHGYPAPLPFLAHVRATVNTLDQAVTWHDAPDPTAAATEVARQCLDEGWVALEATATFAKDGAVRTLRVDDDGRVLLTEKRSA